MASPGAVLPFTWRTFEWEFCRRYSAEQHIMEQDSVGRRFFAQFNHRMSYHPWICVKDEIQESVHADASNPSRTFKPLCAEKIAGDD